MVAFMFNMPVGFPGAVTRAEHATVEAQKINETTPPLNYGTVVVMDGPTSSIRQPGTADVSGFYGFYVRPYPTQGFGVPPGSLSDPLGVASPPVKGIGDVMRRGYMVVKLGGATPAVKGAPANVWVGATGGGQVQGNVTAVAPAANTSIALPGAMFMGAADANGLTEISFNIS